MARVLTYAQLAAATDDFNMRPLSEGGRAIGAGGFGAVYKGQLEYKGSLITVAVKTLDQDEALGAASGITSDEQFEAEIGTLRDMQHRNIVPLVGWSIDGPRKAIAYALMDNGSLGETQHPI